MIRKLSDNEAINILIDLEEKFEFKHQEYWYPLEEVAYRPILVFNTDTFLESSLPQIINKYLISKHETIYEILEFEVNGSCFWESDSKDNEFNRFSEMVLAFKGNEIMIYYSHELTISIAGAPIIEYIKINCSNLKDLEWNGIY